MTKAQVIDKLVKILAAANDLTQELTLVIESVNERGEITARDIEGINMEISELNKVIVKSGLIKTLPEDKKELNTVALDTANLEKTIKDRFGDDVLVQVFDNYDQLKETITNILEKQKIKPTISYKASDDNLKDSNPKTPETGKPEGNLKNNSIYSQPVPEFQSKFAEFITPVGSVKEAWDFFMKLPKYDAETVKKQIQEAEDRLYKAAGKHIFQDILKGESHLNHPIYGGQNPKAQERFNKILEDAERAEGIAPSAVKATCSQSPCCGDDSCKKETTGKKEIKSIIVDGVTYYRGTH